jgi:hypothetical protein
MATCDRTRLNGSRQIGAVRPVIFMCLVFITSSAIADADDGDLLGFRINERISIDDKSKIQYELDAEGYPRLTHISVRSDSKPADMDKVVLRITPITHTVMYISGRIPSSSLAESKLIQKHYYDVLNMQYPEWRGTGRFCDRPTDRFPTQKGFGYELFNCSLYNRKTIGGEYILDVEFTEYEIPNSDNLHVWITLRPAVTERSLFRKSLSDKLESLNRVEMLQFWDQDQEQRYKDADLEGLK